MAELEEKKEVVLHLFLKCLIFCEALTHSSAVAIVSESFEWFVCCRGLCVFFVFFPHSLQSLAPDRATSKLE